MGADLERAATALAKGRPLAHEKGGLFFLRASSSAHQRGGDKELDAASDRLPKIEASLRQRPHGAARLT